MAGGNRGRDRSMSWLGIPGTGRCGFLAGAIFLVPWGWRAWLEWLPAVVPSQMNSPACAATGRLRAMTPASTYVRSAHEATARATTPPLSRRRWMPPGNKAATWYSCQAAGTWSGDPWCCQETSPCKACLGLRISAPVAYVGTARPLCPISSAPTAYSASWEAAFNWQLVEKANLAASRLSR